MKAAYWLAGMAMCGGIALAQDASGHWQGKIKMGEDKYLGVTVDLARNPQGAWIGSMSVTASTTVDVPLANLSVQGADVQFAADLPMRATFAGKLAGDTISGTAKNAEGETTFQLTRAGEAHVTAAPLSTALAKEFLGEWESSVTSDGRTRRVGLRLANGGDGKGTATLIAGEQRMEFPASSVIQTGKELSIEVRAISGAYRGTLGDNGEIAGEWTETGKKLPVIFKRVAK
ncbi:MAG TPA: hypothetical protein VKE70_17715 [Candidatus Solibacter sp.]|nr:hypothetical protein [Candidatus Solibacter sp.]